MVVLNENSINIGVVPEPCAAAVLLLAAVLRRRWVCGCAVSRARLSYYC
jgi:hypothetical protein